MQIKFKSRYTNIFTKGKLACFVFNINEVFESKKNLSITYQFFTSFFHYMNKILVIYEHFTLNHLIYIKYINLIKPSSKSVTLILLRNEN